MPNLISLLAINLAFMAYQGWECYKFLYSVCHTKRLWAQSAKRNCALTILLNLNQKKKRRFLLLRSQIYSIVILALFSIRCRFLGHFFQATYKPQLFSTLDNWMWWRL